MATVSTPATLNSVKSVFGGPNNLLAYLRGGTYVPDISAYSGVAASAPLSLASFAGLVYPYVNIIGCYVLSSKVATAASVSYGIGSTTEYATTNGLVGAFSRTWRNGGSGSDYECYLSGTGTTPSGSALNTWLSLGLTHSWSFTSSVGQSKTFSGTIQLRLSASPFTVLQTESVYMEATSEP